MILGINCGTQGTWAPIVAADKYSRVCGQGRRSLTERANGACEQDLSERKAAMIVAARAEASLRGEDKDAPGVSGQQSGLVALDKYGAVIGPAKLWNDTETTLDNAALIDALGDPKEWFEALGLVPLSDEAGCLGEAIQALWALARAARRKSFQPSRSIRRRPRNRIRAGPRRRRFCSRPRESFSAGRRPLRDGR